MSFVQYKKKSNTTKIQDDSKNQTDSYLDLENLSLILNTEDHFTSNQLIAQLQMKLEDYRSYFLKIHPTEFFSVAMTEYYDRYINEREVKSFQNYTIKRKDVYLSQFEFIEEESRIKTLEKINDYFFSQTEVIDCMETEYSNQCDPNFQPGKYKAHIEKYFYTNELQTLLMQQEALGREIEKYNRKKEKLEKCIANYQASLKEVKDLLLTRKEEIENYRQKAQELETQKQLLEKSTKALEHEKEQLENSRKVVEEIFASQFSKNSQILVPKTPNLSPHYTLNESTEEELDFFETVQRLLVSNKDPVEIACSLIEELKSQVLAFERYKQVDQVELKYLISELRFKEQTMTNYLKSEKNKYLKRREDIEREFRLLEFLKSNKREEEKIKTSYEIIRKEKKKIEEKRQANQLMVDALHAFETQIKNSIQMYKEAYGSLLGVYKAIDSKLKMIYLLLEKKL